MNKYIRINIKSRRSFIRYHYWDKKGNKKFAELHYLRHIALSCLDRPAWPVTKFNMKRAKKLMERK